jgi:hypothetical protein
MEGKDKPDLITRRIIGAAIEEMHNSATSAARRWKFLPILSLVTPVTQNCKP